VTNISEKETQATILHYLQIKGYVYWRVNNTGVFDPTRKVFRKMAAHSRYGVADIFVIKAGVSYFIEVKGTKGYMSPDQKTFRDDVTREGGIFILAKSLDDVMKAGL
jgi:hypothetical protein